MRTIVLFCMLGLSLVAGCATHYHHAKPVKVLKAEHSNRAIVVVHSKPAKHRHCWKHGGHWHCRRH